MAESVTRIRPPESKGYLANPHKGCCTFQHFNGEDLYPAPTWSEEGPASFPLLDEKPGAWRTEGRHGPSGRTKGIVQGYLPSTVSYCRWFWAKLEPKPGQYDFSMIDKSLKMCKRRGQSLAVRLMAYGSVNQPQVPQWYSDKYPMEIVLRSGQKMNYPVLDSDAYLEHWGNVIKAFAAKYDGNPLLESIDVTFIGPWGEGDGKCSPERCDEFVQLWKDAFQLTPRLSLVAGHQLQAGIRSGAGWRCDCFGDLGMRERGGSHTVPRTGSWNHMYDSYPKSIVQANAQEAWRTAPVHFETCGVPMSWYQMDFDIDFIIEQGLKYHGTYFMPKYTYLPDAWIDKLAAFCQQLGYRFVFRQALISRQVREGETFHFEAWIENTGVAPLYHNYDFAIRFRQDDQEEVIVLNETDIGTWLPGDIWFQHEIPMPATFRKGWVELSCGIVNPCDRTSAEVSFASDQVFNDRWLFLQGFELI